MALGVVASLLGGAVYMFARRPRGGGGDSPAPPEPPPLAVAAAPVGEVMACPSCRREFPSWMRFCAYDARPLCPTAELATHDASSCVVCRRCQRSFDATTRFCPVDGDELGPPVDLARAVQRSLTPAPARATGRICPSCTGRYGADEAFCGRDGMALVELH